MPEIQKPSNLNVIWADAGDKIKPDDSKIRTGWLAEIPTRQNFNFLDGRQDQFNAHVNQRGIAEYDPTTEYLAGKSYTQGSDGVIYFCYSTDITGIDPVTDTTNTYWKEAFVTPDGYSGGKRFVGYEVFSSDFTAVPNHRYLIVSPATVTIPTAQPGDAIVIASATGITATIIDSESNTYTLNGKEEGVWVRTSDGWIKLDSGGSSSNTSLNGPTTVTQGSTNSYTISDYNAFSIYTTSASVGTFTRTGDTISLVVPNPANTTQILLTVTRDGEAEYFLVAVGAQSIATPSITYPSQGQTSVEVAPTLAGSAFATVPLGQDTHQSSQWQIASDSGFSTIVYDSGVTTVNKTSNPVPAGTLSLGTVYYSRVRYTGAIIGESAWSTTRTFTTSNQSVVTPVVSVTGGPTNVGETPTISTSAFAVSSGTDTHVSTDWQIIKVSDSSVVFQSLGNTVNKTSIIPPTGLLVVNTQYKARARMAGSSAGSSAWGEYTFTTKPIFFVFGPASAGLPYGGGYYAGANIVISGIKYALIVAPKTMGGESSTMLAMQTGAGTPQRDQLTTNDGLANTDYMMGFSSPAASFAKGLTINGYTDWYVPSLDETEIMYRYLKPTTRSNELTFGTPQSQPNGLNENSDPLGDPYTTSIPGVTLSPLFVQGGVEALNLSSQASTWTSTYDGNFAAVRFWRRSFYNGDCVSALVQSEAGYVRAVRRVPIPT